MVLEGLHHVEVRALTLREAVLAVELELGRDDRVLTPAVHVEGSLGEDERAGVGNGRGKGALKRGVNDGGSTTHPDTSTEDVISTRVDEKARGVDEGIGSHLVGAAERVVGVREGINGVRVVEGLGAKGAEKRGGGVEGRAVVDVGVGLDNPDKLLARVVEVELDLVGGRADRLITSELELLDEVLVGVLSHLAALIRVEEDIVDVEGSGNEGLLVGRGSGDGRGGGAGSEAGHSPEALTDGAEINVDLHLVVLESNKGEGKARVAAEPELEGDVESGLREGVAGGANLSGATGGRAGARDSRERGIRDVRESGRVADHLEVATLLLRGERKLVPDVHPVTVLAVNALATNLDLNLGDDLLTDVI